MKAIVYRHYGSPDVLQFEEINTPAPAANEILIRVRAASVNPLDWHFMRGTPGVIRLLTGLRKPKSCRLGVDVAGIVHSVGRGVTQWKPGDEVYGGARGSFAEFACAKESAVGAKPANLTFEQAAVVPIAGLTALQGLRDKARLEPGQTVLINGASGGVGTFAVQIARWLGAEVTAVCSAKNLALVRSIGAEYAIDYTCDDFTKAGKRYDAAFDLIGNRTLSEWKSALSARGVLVQGGAQPDVRSIDMLTHTVRRIGASILPGPKVVPLLAKLRSADLAVMSRLMTAGTLIPVIDRRYKLAEVPEAIRYVETGHAHGKVVIVI